MVATNNIGRYYYRTIILVKPSINVIAERKFQIDDEITQPNPNLVAIENGTFSVSSVILQSIRFPKQIY